MNNIGRRIRELRKKNGLTQERLADALGVTDKSVSKWECGISTPDLALIGPLTRVLHISADELLGLTEETSDAEREKYDTALRKYRDCETSQLNYAWARAALMDFPDDFRYMEWLAYAEYRLAFDENKMGREQGSTDFMNDMTDNALRRYETVLEHSTDPALIRQAAMGKILVLRFCERIDEAEWSAEFEYPDPGINTVRQVLSLSTAGQELLRLMEEEREQAE